MSAKTRLLGLTSVIFLVSLANIRVPAQGTWTPRSPFTRPPARLSHAVAHDSGRGRSVVFAGYTGTTLVNDTWEWDGTTWSLFAPLIRPAPRMWHALAYDIARGRTVLFGGNVSNFPFTPNAETWEWDGASWTQRFPSAAPSPRYYGALAYDSLRKRVVLFGGKAGTALYNDTWEWDGSTWTQRSPPAAPPQRFGHRLAYDSGRGRTVLFGGLDDNTLPNIYYADTWEWDGSTWTLRTTAVRPSARYEHGLTYDAAHGRCVLFGGLTLPGGFVNDETWEWDGNSWAQRTISPRPAQRSTVLAYHAPTRSVLLFGGSGAGTAVYDDTHEFSGPSLGVFAPFGTGCAGSAGIPALAASAGQVPRLGQGFGLVLTQLQPGAPTLLSIGASNSSWAGIPLPLELGVFGAPGCALYTSAEVILALVNAAGTASTVLPIPNQSALLGARFFVQGFVLDALNALGVVVPNAGVGFVGS